MMSRGCSKALMVSATVSSLPLGCPILTFSHTVSSGLRPVTRSQWTSYGPCCCLGFQDITAIYHLLPSACTLDLPQPALENMEVAQRVGEPTPSFPRVWAPGQSLSASVVKTACLHLLDSMDISRGTLMNSLGSRPILSCTIMQQQPQLLIIIRDSEL